MLPTATIMEIRRLLERGDLSFREIARRLRVSRGIIAAMAKGQRGNYGRDADADPQRSSPRLDVGSPVRCSECGGLVYPPCRLCTARAVQERRLLFRRVEIDSTRPQRAA